VTSRTAAHNAPPDLASRQSSVSPDPLSRAVELSFTVSELGAVRRIVRQLSAEFLLDPERSEDLTLAVNELATNSICHGGGEGMLRMWSDGRTLVCEVRDRGHIVEPWSGKVRPGTDLLSGRGLWLVDQLCDLVQIRSSPVAGSSVRVHMRLPSPRPTAAHGAEA
jgi:anti-sigma regulatory factor (Ser/Thr protein kinase)